MILNPGKDHKKPMLALAGEVDMDAQDVKRRAWICSFVPAVMLEMVQQASFLMLFFWLVFSRCSRQPSAPQFMMTCVWRSSPVTMLPTVRSAGTSTLLL